MSEDHSKPKASEAPAASASATSAKYDGMPTSAIAARESELNYTREKLQITSEEQQSTNVELITVNAELQGKIEQLADIKSQLIGDDLLERARAVLETLVPWESELQSASGTRFLARVQPYRTLDNFIGGVVLTFTDISQRVEALAVQVARTRRSDRR